MADPELLLDPAIRIWVFMPIVVITFLVGLIRHNVSLLLQSDKKVELQQVADSQALIRSRLLREHGKYVPRQSFLMRKHFFNEEEVTDHQWALENVEEELIRGSNLPPEEIFVKDKFA
ncbi:ER membrane complex subunit 3 [Branchiostoma belcheri]|nr:ER membrane complex subunit 3 [Branchiostoma belcheri]